LRAGAASFGCHSTTLPSDGRGLVPGPESRPLCRRKWRGCGRAPIRLTRQCSAR
jgi:hypothetical protein